ncbi:hypothetical protein M405DRAFT_856729 [Rhizopogon salebrosus TDB-379]|nr:hypothetical protein M405DRAFT_856729 [Rhizopogon salebrosus TDB-379]
MHYDQSMMHDISTMRARLPDLVDEPLEELDIHQENPLHAHAVAGPSQLSTPVDELGLEYVDLALHDVLSSVWGVLFACLAVLLTIFLARQYLWLTCRRNTRSHVLPQPDEHPPSEHSDDGSSFVVQLPADPFETVP